MSIHVLAVVVIVQPGHPQMYHELRKNVELPVDALDKP